jgi:hypothetical protein
MFDIRNKLADMKLPQGGTLGEYFFKQPKDPYAQYSIKWDGEWQVTYETFRDMGAAYAVGLILIYLLVVAQFKSYLVPLIIMAPIPLTIIGVMPGHALFGAQYTATSMIGMIALAGIIVRNSILLVDFINEQVAGGMDFAEAVIQAAAVRAKPIVLTGLAAMLGALFIVDDPIFAGLALSLDLRHLRLHLADAGGDSGSVLRGNARPHRQIPIEELHMTVNQIRSHHRRIFHHDLAGPRPRHGPGGHEQAVLAVVHRLRRRQPVPERLHQILSAGLDSEEAGRKGINWQ